MSVVNMFADILGDAKEKAKFMILLSTIMAFFEYCIEKKIEPTLEAIATYIKDKTGAIVGSAEITFLLNIMTGNVKIFVMFLLNEGSEKLAESMVHNPIDLWKTMRSGL